LTIAVPITPKMGEALLWTLAEIGDVPDRPPADKTDPLFVLLDEGYARADIMPAVLGMFQFAYDKEISEPLTDLQKAILRVCVENSSWITAYYENELVVDKVKYTNEARATLRELATRLEAFGIEVNFIPDD